jgi:hypothetical protein
MPVITIAAVTLNNWQQSSDVQLRIYALESFIDSAGNLINAGNPTEDESVSGNWFVAAACTLAGTQLTIAQVQLSTTTDSDNPNALYSAWFFTTEGERIGPFQEFQTFKLPATLPSNTTWKAVAQAQGGNI